jgi:mxaJ protein
MKRLLLLASAAAALGAPVRAETLKVCADPNNLPFSNEKGEGFENRIVELLAKDLGYTVEWVWRAQRRGYVREGLKEGRCDLVPGVASTMEMLATTRPYYRSSYVFVSRADRGLDIASLDDARLRQLTVGVQMIGDDFANTPPAHALARRGIVRNVRGYMIYGDYDQPNPPARIVEAVADGDVDVALVWGPLAGWFASREHSALRLAPVTPRMDGPMWPMVFDVSMGVRKDSLALRRALDGALERHRAEIDEILDAYGVPKAP